MVNASNHSKLFLLDIKTTDLIVQSTSCYYEARTVYYCTTNLGGIAYGAGNRINRLQE
ncbi:hypothetical protein GCM10023187_08520 [Nibrella viscosa]|uniref:Uncharacterized protein n=1 Tax=Nibrella viscosa TaxID=1084524 RepID=A0ABP8JZP1_9BACT